MVEHPALNRQVGGSSPPGITKSNKILEVEVSNTFYLILLGKKSSSKESIKYTAIWVSKFNYILISKRNERSLSIVHSTIAQQHPHWFSKIQWAKQYLAIVKKEFEHNSFEINSTEPFYYVVDSVYMG